jgi:beta-fructofuranosidase
MTLPRELSFHDGRLYQQPVRELSAYYGSEVFYRKVPVTDEISLYGVDGRIIDLDIKISPAQDEPLYRYFVIRFAMNEEYYSEAMYSPDTGIFVISREYSGTRKGGLHQRNCLVPESMDGNLSVRILLDRYSFEIFINDGRYAMSAVIYTDPGAAQISFRAGGKAVIDVAKREIKL